MAATALLLLAESHNKDVRTLDASREPASVPIKIEALQRVHALRLAGRRRLQLGGLVKLEKPSVSCLRWTHETD